MRIDIQSVDMKVGQELRNRIEDKLSKFDRYFDDSALCEVKCTTDGPDLKRVEITLHVDKKIYRAERSEDDIFTALDSAIDVLQGQIRKHKTLMSNMNGKYDSMKKFVQEELVDNTSADEETDEVNYDFRYKSFEIQAMSDEEAAMQMDLLNHSFFVYISDETGHVNVIYKRKGDSYGVIEPIY